MMFGFILLRRLILIFSEIFCLNGAEDIDRILWIVTNLSEKYIHPEDGG
jgi:hypothetical protein